MAFSCYRDEGMQNPLVQRRMVEIGKGEISRDDQGVGLIVFDTGSPDGECLFDRACSDEGEDILGVWVASVDTPGSLGKKRNLGSSSLFDLQIRMRKIWTAAIYSPRP
jgi:hypothetical protein